MAKRKRLTPAQATYLEVPGPALETKSMGFPPRPPIAQVAGDSASAAALLEVTDELRRARDEGRLVQELPLAAIVADHLTRDRLMADAEDLGALVDSIRENGQRTPIEVVELEDGRFGLISGWRRLTALELLATETGEERFQTIQALLRRPENASAAYVAMVEENEIRVGLSYFERARVAVLAVEHGIFPNEKVALQRLFATASRAKRSKIRSFLLVYHALAEVLRFPVQLNERLGLQLAKALEEGRGAGLTARLAQADSQTAEAEQGLIAEELKLLLEAKAGAGEKPAKVPAKSAAAASPEEWPKGEQIRHGVHLDIQGGFLKRRLVLTGTKVDEAFQHRLIEWLRQG